MTEQPAETGQYFKVMLVYILVTIAADGFGILLGTLVNPIVSDFFCHLLHNKLTFSVIRLERNILRCGCFVLHDRFLGVFGAFPAYASVHAVRQQHQPTQVLPRSFGGHRLRVWQN